VTKLNASGSALLYSTYLDDPIMEAAIDRDGNAYVTGMGAFVVKLSPKGALLTRSVYLGSTSIWVSGIALDRSGNAYITGIANVLTTTAGAFQRTCRGFDCAFVAKFSGSGALVYSSLLGGSNGEAGYGVAVDSNGNAYITGYTGSTDFPVTATAFQKKLRGGTSVDAFVTKFNASGSGLLYSTYFGGSGEDVAFGIAVDSSGNAYITGYTRSWADFPTTPGAFQPHYTPCCDDGFVAKLTSNGSRIYYSSFLGGNNVDNAEAIAVDQYNQAYVVGRTSSSTFPQTSNKLQGFRGLRFDAFVITLNAAGSRIAYYSTFLGGTSDDDAMSVAVDRALNVYVTGFTLSSDFPVSSNAYSKIPPAGSIEGFVAKLVIAADQATSASAPASAATGSNLMYTFSVFNKGPDNADVAVLTTAVPVGTGFVSYATTNGSCATPSAGSAGVVTCKRSNALVPSHSWGPITLTVKVNAAAGTTITNTAKVSANTQDLFPANNTKSVSVKIN
jgi:uncharacterized repeat protein (TIGR01451 family)